MAIAYVFPGQGAQYVGMGSDLYESNPKAKELFDKANEILGYSIIDVMFEGTEDDGRLIKALALKIDVFNIKDAGMCALRKEQDLPAFIGIKRHNLSAFGAGELRGFDATAPGSG